MTPPQEPDAHGGPLVTDEVRALIGQATPPFEIEIEEARIRRILADVGEPDIPTDGDLPPWLLVGISLGMKPQEHVPELLPAGAVFQSEWRFLGRIRLGLPLRGVSRITDIRDRMGGRYGHTVIVSSEVDIATEAGELVEVYSSSRILFRPPGGTLPPRDDAPRPGAEPALEPAAPPLGQRRYHDVAVGDSIGWTRYWPTEATGVAFLPLFRQALVSQSNDLGAALDRGYEGIVVPTTAQMCHIARLTSSWAGDPFALRSIRGAFREPDYLGRPITFTGHVVHKDIVDGQGIIDLECAAHAAGHQSVRATAQLVLPM